MTRKIICVLCPRSCTVVADEDENGEISILEFLSGQPCPRGEEYVKEEMTSPMRTVTSTMEVEGGTAPLVSLRTSAPVPLQRAAELVKSISALSVAAPVVCGQIVGRNVLGLGVDVVATRSVGKLAE